MTKPIDLIKIKETEFSSLKKRQKVDEDLINSVAYEMQDWDDKKVEKVFHVTLPNAAIFFSKMVAIVAGVSRIPKVESEDLDDEQKAYIINLLQDVDIESDNLLNNRDEMDAFATHSGYFCGRGWSAEFIRNYEEDGKVTCDNRPVDPYFLTFETGRKGKKWVCFNTTRSKDDIEEEYEKYNAKVSGTSAVIRNWWNDDDEYVYVDDKEIVKRANPFGYPPFVIQAVPYGAGLLKTVDFIKRTGESIFYPHRDMFKEMNFMASLLKTQAFDDLRPGLQGEKLLEAYPSQKSITEIRERPYELIPRRDMTNAMRAYQGIIDSVIQRAGLSSINEGTLTFPIAAVLFARLMAERNSLTLPRHQAMGLLYSARTRMILKQLIALGGSFELGEEGMKRKYEASKLEGSYTVSWKYQADSLEDIATRSSIGNAQRGLYSDKTIRATTLQLENPEEEENLLEMQEAKRKEPLLTDLERIFSLIDEDTDESNAEAWILFHKLITILEQRVAGGVAEPGVLPPVKPSQQLPVFGGKGGAQPVGEA